LFSFWNARLNAQFKKEKRSEPKNAAPKDEMTNPDTHCASNQNKKPFTTKVNNPSVKRVIGSVRRRSIGRSVILIHPHKKASHSAVEKSRTSMPGTTLAIMKNETAFTIQRARRRIRVSISITPPSV
jgi:hypothetical protein